MHRFTSIAAALTMLCATPALAQAAPLTIDLGNASLTIKGNSSFSNLAYGTDTSSGMNRQFFSWDLDYQPVGTNDLEVSFALPEFTLTANTGYTLADLSSYLGDFSYVYIGKNSKNGANATVSGAKIQLDDGAWSKLGKQGLDSVEAKYALGAITVTMGNYSLSEGALANIDEAFTSFSMKNGQLTLSTKGNASFLGSLDAVNKPELRFSFVAAAVPEPETYTMILTGIGLLGMVARRRTR